MVRVCNMCFRNTVGAVEGRMSGEICWIAEKTKKDKLNECFILPIQIHVQCPHYRGFLLSFHVSGRREGFHHLSYLRKQRHERHILMKAVDLVGRNGYILAAAPLGSKAGMSPSRG